MQFQGKLMKQTWENGKKPSFGPDFGAFGPNLDPKYFFLRILPQLDLYALLQAIIVSNFK